MTKQSSPSRVSTDAAQARDGAAQSLSGPFVINLCSSTTPMALAHPEGPELQRFSFFVSRRFEEGRERFRLHMGHFDTLADAEEWLPTVRDLYPGAWAGEAPGKKLKAAQEAAAERVAARASAEPPAAGPVQAPIGAPAAASVAAPPPASARAPAPAAAAVAAAAPATSTPQAAPLLHHAGTTWGDPFAAKSAASAPVAKDPPRAPLVAPPADGIPVVQPPKPARLDVAQVDPASPARALPAATAVAAASSVPARPKIAAAKPDPMKAAPASPPAEAVSRRVPAAAAAATTPAKSAAPEPAAALRREATAPKPAPASTPTPPAPPGLSLSNVRQVLADLDGGDDASPTREMPRPSVRTTSSTPSPAVISAAAPRSAQPAVAEDDDPGLTDTQVLSMLERRRDAAARPPPTPVVGAPEEIKLLRPDDLSTMKELRHGLTANAQVSFAVQLEWSVQPIVLKNVPPLAIFSAYTLYTVEGNREGRKWYGLRLGFFSDTISAKQVALYVRSEFAAVAVVPVSGRERTKASEDGRLSPSALGTSHHKDKPQEEFKLLDDTSERPAPALPQGASSAAAAPQAAPAPARAAPPSKRAATKSAPSRDKKAVPARAGEPRKPVRAKSVEEQLEETLEILGASELTLDDGRKELINDSGVRHLKVSVESGGTGTFAKLLDRLSDRLIRGR